MIFLWIGLGAYGAFGSIAACIGWAYAWEGGCPWYVLPFVAAGFALTWPLAIVDILRDKDPWRSP